MKRLILILLCLSLTTGLAACSGTSAPTEAPLTPTGAPAPTEATDAAVQEAPTVDSAQTERLPTMIALLQRDTCAFSVTEVEYNEHLGLRLHVLCENFSDRPLLFTWNNTSVCGYMYDPFWAEEVAAGKKVNSTIDFDTYALEQMGIGSVDEIDFTLSVMDSEEFLDGPLVNEAFTIYPTGKTAEEVVYPEYVHKNGETVVAENDVLTFIIEDVEDEVSEYYTLNCYLANHTGKNLMVSWDGVSVNGFMVDPFWAATVSAGKQLYTQIHFFRSDLEQQGIEDVTEIEFSLVAYDNDNWDTDYLLNETYTFNP